jgi:hypothetical protein
MRRWLLPDAAPGQSLGTPRQRGQKTVTVQGTPSLRLLSAEEGMARVFAVS